LSRLVNEYQTKVFQRQIEVEGRYGNTFVSDRAFDNLAYAADHALIVADLIAKLMLEMYRIPYLPIESVSMQERVRIVDFVLADKVGKG
jgi:hypothetical protein